MAFSITTKTDRKKLAERRDPYFMDLGNGLSLGFRRGPDKWIARWRGKDKKYRFEALGQHDDYADAKKEAETWRARMTGASSKKVIRGTVRDALDAYIKDLREKKNRPDAADNTEKAIECAVLNDPIADIRVEDLTLEDVEGWRERVEVSKTPRNEVPDDEKQKALDRRTAGESIGSICADLKICRSTFFAWQAGRFGKRSKVRAPQSVNRYSAYLTAGLNAALKLGYTGNAAAWKIAALDEESTEAVFLSPAQRAELIKFSPPVLQEYLRGLQYTGARPSELAKATVDAFDVANGTLMLWHRKGRKAKVRTRYVTLSTEAIRFFKSHCHGKLPKAALIFSSHGDHWKPHDRCRRIAIAIRDANRGKETTDPLYIPDGASAYSFRHSFISEALQIYNVNVFRVAKLTGTSVAMIEKTYGHYIPDGVREAFDSIKLA